jgi:hypothetical protein
VVSPQPDVLSIVEVSDSACHSCTSHKVFGLCALSEVNASSEARGKGGLIGDLLPLRGPGACVLVVRRGYVVFLNGGSCCTWVISEPIWSAWF